MSIDHGTGYLAAAAVTEIANEAAAHQLVVAHYGDQAGTVVARALHMVPSMTSTLHEGLELAGVLALLHRLTEETSATIDDVRDSGLSDRAVALIDNISARPGESPRQTAMRAAADEMAVRLLFNYGSDLRLSRKPRQGNWWPTDSDAWEIIHNASEQQKERDEARRKAASYDYQLPTRALEEAEVPIAWANAVKDAFISFTEADRLLVDSRVCFYDHKRVVRIDAGRHLVECFQSGMSAEQYIAYIGKTNLTWTQIPAWHNAGLSVEFARDADVFDRNPAAAKRALDLAGSEADAVELVSWTGRMIETRSDAANELARTISWSTWRSTENMLSSPAKVNKAWQALVAARGSEDLARRALTLHRVVPVPTNPGEGRFAKRRYPDHDAHRELVARWDETALPVERIQLLLGAGITDPAQALAPENAALSDDQLRMAAAL